MKRQEPAASSRRIKLWPGVSPCLFVLTNCVAFGHAYRMTHFVGAGEPTKSPEKLSAWQRVQVLLTGVVIPKPVLRGKPEGVEYRTVRIDGDL